MSQQNLFLSGVFPIRDAKPNPTAQSFHLCSQKEKQKKKELTYMWGNKYDQELKIDQLNLK